MSHSTTISSRRTATISVGTTITDLGDGQGDGWLITLGFNSRCVRWDLGPLLPLLVDKCYFSHWPDGPRGTALQESLGTKAHESFQGEIESVVVSAARELNQTDFNTVVRSADRWRQETKGYGVLEVEGHCPTQQADKEADGDCTRTSSLSGAGSLAYLLHFVDCPLR